MLAVHVESSLDVSYNGSLLPLPITSYSSLEHQMDWNSPCGSTWLDLASNMCSTAEVARKLDVDQDESHVLRDEANWQYYDSFVILMARQFSGRLLNASTPRQKLSRRLLTSLTCIRSRIWSRMCCGIAGLWDSIAVRDRTFSIFEF
jgi:hypothetical protein